MTEASGSSEQPSSLAPHHLRLFALIVDYLVVLALLKIVEQALLGRHWDLVQAQSAEAPVWPWLTGLALLLALRDLPGGAWPGKYISGIAVTLSSDPARRAPPAMLLLRNLTLVLLPLEGVLVFTDTYMRRLGDRLAGTVVVVPTRTAHLGRRFLVLSMLFLATILAGFLVTSWNLRRSAAYETALAAASASPQVRSAFAAPAALDTVPEFGSAPELRLGQGEQDGRAVVVLAAEGASGEFQVEVTLRLQTGGGAWEVEQLRLIEEE